MNQKTKFNLKLVPDVRNYKSYCKSNQNNSIPHGGVAIFMRNDISSHEFKTITNFQAIAATVKN